MLRNSRTGIQEVKAFCWRIQAKMLLRFSLAAYTTTQTLPIMCVTDISYHESIVGRLADCDRVPQLLATMRIGALHGGVEHANREETVPPCLRLRIIPYGESQGPVASESSAGTKK